MAELVSRLLHDSYYRLMERRQIPKARFPFRGMHVEVHEMGSYLHEQTRDRVSAAGQNRAVAIFQRLHQPVLLDPPPVHEHHQPRAVTARELRARADHRYLKLGEVALRLEQIAGHYRAAEHVRYPLPQLGGGQRGVRLAVYREPKRDLRMSERLLQHHPPAQGGLGTGTAQEAAPRRQIGEQPGYLDARARRRCRSADAPFAAVRDQPRRLRRRACAGDHFEARAGGDTGQCLAAESERGDVLQVVLVADLGGRVAHTGALQVGAGDAAAVVMHRDLADAAGVELHVDLARAGVKRVVDQFAHDRKRTLDHLAGGDAGGYVSVEHANDAVRARICRHIFLPITADGPVIMAASGLMVVSMLHLTIDLPGVSSLKEKRRVIGSLKERVRHKYRVSVAEVGANDLWNVAEIGCAVVSNSHTFGESVLHKVIGFAEEHLAFPIRSAQVFSEHY